MLQQGMNAQLSKAGAPLKFGPAEGADFFAPFGWQNPDVRSLLKTAAQARPPQLENAPDLVPARTERPGPRPWSGICMLQKTTR